jgi:fructosamine-3-kinase
MEGKIANSYSNETRDGKVYIKKSVTKGDVTKSICVEEVENGYFVKINTYGYKGEGDKKEYFDKTMNFISKDNPFDKEEEMEVEEASEITNMISALKNYM